MVETHTPQVDV